MIKRSILVVLTAFGLSLPSRIVSAQSGRPWSLQGSALYVGVGGEGFDGVKGGVGFEGQIRRNIPGGLSIGAGYQRSSHSPEAGRTYDNVTLSGVFVEPRYVPRPISPRVAPYLALRIARLSQATEFVGGSSDVTATQFNAGGGVLIALRPGTNLDLGATFGTVSFGKVSSLSQQELGRGTNAVLRAGLSVGF